MVMHTRSNSKSQQNQSLTSDFQKNVDEWQWCRGNMNLESDAK